MAATMLASLFLPTNGHASDICVYRYVTKPIWNPILAQNRGMCCSVLPERPARRRGLRRQSDVILFVVPRKGAAGTEEQADDVAMSLSALATSRVPRRPSWPGVPGRPGPGLYVQGGKRGAHSLAAIYSGR